MSTKKGISPLIATVLLIAISMMIVYIISNWSVSLVREETAELTNKTEEIVSCGLILIDDVYMDFSYNTTHNISRVYVKSVNAIDKIVSANLFNKDGELATITNHTTLPLNMSKGDMKAILFDITDEIRSCANFSKVTITTKCISDTYTKTPRGC